MSYDINLKHLEYFIKVARLGSINKAAQMLYVSQSHLGKIIHDLEETVGAPLLNRSRQGVTLTPEGNEFLERSVRILKEMEGMHLRPLKEMEKTEPLAVSMTKFSHVMESFITIVRRYQDQPEFTHRLYEGQLEDVIEDVVSGRADIGIFHFDSQRHEEIQMMAAAKGLTYRFLSYVEPHINATRPVMVLVGALVVFGERLNFYQCLDDATHRVWKSSLFGICRLHALLHSLECMCQGIGRIRWNSWQNHPAMQWHADASAVPISLCHLLTKYGSN